jgi:hypothetical protein
MKKIIYIYSGVDSLSYSSGVQKKILSKIKGINDLGIFCQGISFSNQITEPLIINKYLTVIPYEKNSRKYFNSFYQQKLLFRAVSEYLSSEMKLFTHVIFRYPLASMSLLYLTKKFNKKIVFEHNTKEVEEVALQAKLFRTSLKFSIKPGYFIYLIERGYLTVWQEKILGKKIFKYAKSGLAVTTEIAEYEKNRQSKYNVNVLTNGIEVEKSKLRTPLDFNGLELKLFMLLGSQNVWHGVDRLVKSIANYKGTCLFNIDLIGSISKEDESLIEYYKMNDRIRIMPSVNSETLDYSLNQYHFGIGTLAAFRKGLTEATPLKTREYMARGFAAIIGYEDTDFENHTEFKKYCLQVKPDESLIDFEMVVEFAKNVFREENHHLKIRELAVKYLDVKVKMQQLLQLLN